MVEAAPTRWTQAEDLIDAWIGEDIPTDLRLVSIWIARAERVLRKEFPSLPTRVTSGG